jgi:hypothetical protein
MLTSSFAHPPFRAAVVLLRILPPPANRRAARWQWARMISISVRLITGCGSGRELGTPLDPLSPSCTRSIFTALFEMETRFETDPNFASGSWIYWTPE